MNSPLGQFVDQTQVQALKTEILESFPMATGPWRCLIVDWWIRTWPTRRTIQAA